MLNPVPTLTRQITYLGDLSCDTGFGIVRRTSKTFPNRAFKFRLNANARVMKHQTSEHPWPNSGAPRFITVGPYRPSRTDAFDPPTTIASFAMLYCLAPSTSRLVQNLPRQSCVRRVSRRLAPKTLSRALGSSPSYHWIRDVELLERYRPGGYHPVSIGDCINCRYSIVDKLGFGDYSTVWLAHDTIASRYVALKIGTADASAKTSLEVRIIQELSSNDGYRSAGRDSIPAIFEAFEIKSPNGTHQAYAMTPARCNLWQAIEMSLFPLNVARALCGGLILAVARVHQHGYCHGGEFMRLDNILMSI